MNILLNSSKNNINYVGCGFLGSNMCKRLVKEGENVICIDNLYTGFESNISQLLLL